MTDTTFNMGDSYLAKQVAACDEAAFARLFAKFGPKMHSYFAKVLHSDSLAEEMVQELFMGLWIKRHYFENVENLHNYIIRAASRDVFDWRLNRSKQDKAFKELAEMESAGSLEKELELNNLKKAFKGAFECLTPRQKEVFVMQRDMNMSQYEIAQKLGVTIKTVKNTMRDAMERIREYLNDNGYTLLALLYMMHNY